MERKISNRENKPTDFCNEEEEIEISSRISSAKVIKQNMERSRRLCQSIQLIQKNF